MHRPSPPNSQRRSGTLTAKGERLAVAGPTCAQPLQVIVAHNNTCTCRLIDKKNLRRYDDCLSYTMVSSKKALKQAGLDKEV